jgi:hypothetical protein
MAFQGFLRVTPPVVTRPTAEASSGSDAYLGPADGLRSRPIGHDNIPSPTGQLAMRKLRGQIGWAYRVVEIPERDLVEPRGGLKACSSIGCASTSAKQQPAVLRDTKADLLVDTQVLEAESAPTINSIASGNPG